MIIYLIVFVASLLSFKLSTIRKTKKIIAYFYLGIGIIIPVIIGSFRDDNVGTDINNYVSPIFNKALISNSFEEFYNNVFYFDTEMSFLIITYIVSLFSKGLNSVLFVLQLLTMFFTVLAIKKSKYSKYIVPSMFIFFCNYYCLSFNLMRQVLAISVFMLAFVMYENATKMKFYFYGGLSYICHKTSLFGLIIVLFNNFFVNAKNKLKWLLFVIPFFLLNYVKDLILALSTIMFERYAAYVEYGGSQSSGGSHLTEICIRFFILFLVVYAFMKKYLNGREKDFLFSVLLIEIILLCFSPIFGVISRLVYYIGALEVFYIPYLLDKLKKDNLGLLFKTTMYCLILFQWYWLYIYNNVGETSTYTSKILGI